MEFKFTDDERKAIFKRQQELSHVISLILELRGVTGSAELLPDFSGYKINEVNSDGQ